MLITLFGQWFLRELVYQVINYIKCQSSVCMQGFIITWESISGIVSGHVQTIDSALAFCLNIYLLSFFWWLFWYVPTYKPSNPKVSVNYCTLSWHDFFGCLKYLLVQFPTSQVLDLHRLGGLSLAKMLSKCFTFPHYINFIFAFYLHMPMPKSDHIVPTILSHSLKIKPLLTKLWRWSFLLGEKCWKSIWKRFTFYWIFDGIFL